jgi:lysine 2,3-aminomutase
VKDVPGGVGKTPIAPSYIISRSDRMVIFRNYEGVIGRFIEPDDVGSDGCRDGCQICEARRARGLDDPEIGLTKLFSGEVSALEPAHLDRHERNEQARKRRKEDA